MRKVITSIAIVGALVRCGGFAGGANQALIGKKLLMKNNADPSKNKTVILIKDANVNAPASQPTTGTICIVGTPLTNSSTLDASDDADPGQWKTIGGGFKYSGGAGGPNDPCKVVLIKDAKLVKAVCKGTDVDFDVDLGGPVNVAVVAGGEKYCVAFGDPMDPGGCTEAKDGSDSKTYLSKNCTAVGNCAAFGGTACSPSGAFLDAASLF